MSAVYMALSLRVMLTSRDVLRRRAGRHVQEVAQLHEPQAAGGVDVPLGRLAARRRRRRAGRRRADAAGRNRQVRHQPLWQHVESCTCWCMHVVV